jgi:hypothetical protein
LCAKGFFVLVQTLPVLEIRFPSMPRVNLKRIRPLVWACARIDLPYSECGLSHSYRQALRHLDAMGTICTRSLDTAHPGCTTSRLESGIVRG